MNWWVMDILIKENVTITPQVKRSVWDALTSLATTPIPLSALFMA